MLQMKCTIHVTFKCNLRFGPEQTMFAKAVTCSVYKATANGNSHVNISRQQQEQQCVCARGAVAILLLATAYISK